MHLCRYKKRTQDKEFCTSISGSGGSSSYLHHHPLFHEKPFNENIQITEFRALTLAIEA